MSDELLKAENINIEYRSSDFSLSVQSFSLEAQSPVALLGPSGCGKTTFIEVLAGVKTPDKGSVTIAKQDVFSLSESQRRALRLSHIGFVFQEFELLPYLSVLDNVLVPIRLKQGPGKEDKDRAEELLKRLGLSGKRSAYPAMLSQGEKQRVAIARSLIGRPTLVIADEPTGNLDSATSDVVIDLLLTLTNDYKAGLLVVTHDPGILDRFSHVHDCRELFSA